MKLLPWTLAIFLCAPCVRGQEATQVASQTGLLHGVVVDPSGAVIPGVDVMVYSDVTAIAHVQTDASGAFSFSGMPREYRIEARAPGFSVLRSSGVPFSEGGFSRFILMVAPAGSGYPVTDTRQSPTPLQPQSQSTLQVSPVRQEASSAPLEYGVLAQGGVGTSDRSGYKFLLLGGHAGKVLTPDVGSGILQGNFEYAVEVFPFWQSYTPRFQKVSCVLSPGTVSGYVCSQPYTVGGTYTGVSITPIMLRWNFTHGERWMPWVQGAGGVVWTNHKYPAIGNTNTADIASNGPSGDTSVWNFTPQFGIGTHYFLKPRRSLDFSANAVHISSASLGDKNPGVNASVQFSVGYTWWK